MTDPNYWEMLREKKDSSSDSANRVPSGNKSVGEGSDYRIDVSGFPEPFLDMSNPHQTREPWVSLNKHPSDRLVRGGTSLYRPVAEEPDDPMGAFWGDRWGQAYPLETPSGHGGPTASGLQLESFKRRGGWGGKDALDHKTILHRLNQEQYSPNEAVFKMGIERGVPRPGKILEIDNSNDLWSDPSTLGLTTSSGSVFGGPSYTRIRKGMTLPSEVATQIHEANHAEGAELYPAKNNPKRLSGEHNMGYYAFDDEDPINRMVRDAKIYNEPISRDWLPEPMSTWSNMRSTK